MFICTPERSEESERIGKESQAAMGFVMNLTQAWAWRPDVYHGFSALRGKLTSQSTLTKRHLAVIVCATASALRDAYCSLACGNALTQEAGAPVAAALIAGARAELLTRRTQRWPLGAQGRDRAQRHDGRRRAVAPHVVFKGGTSLSKVFGAIERFSEDIDLAVSPQSLGVKAAELDEAPSSRTRLRSRRPAATSPSK